MTITTGTTGPSASSGPDEALEQIAASSPQGWWPDGCDTTGPAARARETAGGADGGAPRGKDAAR